MNDGVEVRQEREIKSAIVSGCANKGESVKVQVKSGAREFIVDGTVRTVVKKNECIVQFAEPILVGYLAEMKIVQNSVMYDSVLGCEIEGLVTTRSVHVDVEYGLETRTYLCVVESLDKSSGRTRVRFPRYILKNRGSTPRQGVKPTLPGKIIMTDEATAAPQPKPMLADGEKCMLEVRRDDGTSLMIPGIFEGEEGAVGFRVSDRVWPFTINPRDSLSLNPLGAIV